MDRRSPSFTDRGRSWHIPMRRDGVTRRSGRVEATSVVVLTVRTSFWLGTARILPRSWFLDSLGIDFGKESEVHHYGRKTVGLHTYRGWFYLVGSIEDGPESWRKPPKSNSERRYDRIGHSFQVELNKKSDYGFADWETVLISAGFADRPCVEIDFYTDLPWLYDAPEPGL
jgi:hypothetical protein